MFINYNGWTHMYINQDPHLKEKFFPFPFPSWVNLIEWLEKKLTPFCRSETRARGTSPMWASSFNKKSCHFPPSPWLQWWKSHSQFKSTSSRTCDGDTKSTICDTNRFHTSTLYGQSHPFMTLMAFFDGFV